MNAPRNVDAMDEPRDGFHGMLPIAVGTLAAAAELDFDLFVRGDSNAPVLFRGVATRWNRRTWFAWSSSHVTTLYIQVADHEQYCGYLRQVVLDNPALPAVLEPMFSRRSTRRCPRPPSIPTAPAVTWSLRELRNRADRCTLQQ